MLPNLLFIQFTVHGLKPQSKVKADEYPVFLAEGFSLFPAFCILKLLLGKSISTVLDTKCLCTLQCIEWQKAPGPAHQEKETWAVERYEEDLRPFMLLFAPLLFKSQSFQQQRGQQSPLMPTCQLLPCMNREKPFSPASQFQPPPAGSYVMENPAADNPAHGPVQVHGCFCPSAKPDKPTQSCSRGKAAAHAWHLLVSILLTTCLNGYFF